MTQMKERVVNIVQRLPDDKTISQLAYQDLQKYRKEGVQEINDKEELAQALEEEFDELRKECGIAMPEMREKNGIIYFDKPYKTTLVSWVLEHELCDSLVLDKEELIYGGCDEWIYVRCYARSREYNDRLYSDVYLSELKNEGLRVLYGSECQQE